jgi:RsiW-degrading membrane proteinase PrsW (M82 family)
LPFALVALAYCFTLAMPFVLFLTIQALPGESVEGDGSDSYLLPLGISNDTYEVIIRLALFSSVLCFGALGSAISLISRARNGEAVTPGITTQELVSVQTVGAVFALILSLMFMGELIAGSMFPIWKPFYNILYSPPAFAKLLVWSFIAGFFERFVPHMLENISTRPEKQKALAQDTASDRIGQATNPPPEDLPG